MVNFEKIFRFSFLLLLGMTFGFHAWAGDISGSVESAGQVGVGARATGMGGAFVAVADDATAGYWNPAGLGLMGPYLCEAGMQYAFLPNGLASGYLSYAFQAAGAGSFSISWINFMAKDIPGADEQGQLTGSYTSAEDVFYISYGRKIFEFVEGLSLGANLKLLHQTLSGVTGTGYGADLGVLWQPVAHWGHTVGLNIQNLFQRVAWQTDNPGVDLAPVNVKLGAALKFLPSDDPAVFNHLLVAGDLDWAGKQSLDYHVGLEYWLAESLGARAGVNSREATVGFSFRPDYYELDYAFHYDMSGMSNHQHRLSLLLRFQDSSPAKPQEPLASAPLSKNSAEADEVLAGQSVTGPVPAPRAPEKSMRKIPAKILELRRIGGRASTVILNVGKSQRIHPGDCGEIQSAGKKLSRGSVEVSQVDPEKDLCLADVLNLSQDFEESASVLIEVPMER